MVFFFIYKLLRHLDYKLNNIIFLGLGIIIYSLLFNFKYIKIYSSLIIPIDLYLVLFYKQYIDIENINKKNKIDISKYKNLIKNLYLKYNKINLDNLSLTNNLITSFQYKNIYKPTNLKLEDTLKHTVNNINKNI
tara:strand:- start:262 stop:666 length:405 start_codon:yes stop_codon:yes gene_type:complete